MNAQSGASKDAKRGDAKGGDALTNPEDSRLAELRRRHGQRDGAGLLAAMRMEFPGRLGVISSFGVESAVLLDIVAQIDANLPVIFLDTGALFDETHAYRAALVQHLGLTDIRHLHPTSEDLAVARDLWLKDPDRCCHLRKVAPLQGAVAGFDALIDGRKKFHGDDRLALQTIEPGDQGIFKISPLANWSEERLQQAFASRGLPPHPLAAKGFRSVGCWPCSRVALAGEGPRSGRWAGAAKTECGIHLLHGEEAAE
jgi:phosphoadenosine phosphosulfate reductase